MTWRKTGSEFDDECALADLTNGAYRTHMEAIGYVYTVELMTCRFPKRSLPRFASSPTLSEDIRELIGAGFWQDASTEYEIVHHADVIRQSLAAQQKQRAISKKTSAKYRQKKAEEPGTDNGGTTEVTRHVTPNADRQTDKQLGTGVSKTCEHGKNLAWWKCEECDGRKTA